MSAPADTPWPTEDRPGGDEDTGSRPALTRRSHPDLMVWAGHLAERRRCPRQHGNRIALGIASPDPAPVTAATTRGLLTHRELQERHDRWEAHGAVALACEAPDHHVEAVQADVRAHLDLCPAEDGARYLAGEQVLVTRLEDLGAVVLAIVDAVWEHADGTIELRDYKTGAAPPGPAEDPAALVHALLARTHWPEHPSRVTYELLADAPTTAELPVTQDTVEAALGAVGEHVAALRRGEWEARPGPHCRWCDYRRSCPSSQAAAADPS